MKCIQIYIKSFPSDASPTPSGLSMSHGRQADSPPPMARRNFWQYLKCTLCKSLQCSRHVRPTQWISMPPSFVYCHAQKWEFYRRVEQTLKAFHEASSLILIFWALPIVAVLMIKTPCQISCCLCLRRNMEDWCHWLSLAVDLIHFSSVCHVALFLRLIRLYPSNIVDRSMKREEAILAIVNKTAQSQNTVRMFGRWSCRSIEYQNWSINYS